MSSIPGISENRSTNAYKRSSIESPPSSHTPDYSPPRTPEGVSSTSPIDSPPPHLLKKSIIKDDEYDEDENYNIGD